MKYILLTVSLLTLMVHADVTATWVPGETSLADGLVTVAYNDAGLVTNLAASVSGNGIITLTGMEPLAFADGACLQSRADCLRLDVPVTGAGSLAIQAMEKAVECDLTQAEKKELPELEADAVVVAERALLDNLRVDHVQYDKGNRPYVVIDSHSVGKPFYEVRGEGTYSCQMQVVDGGWAKCVQLCLKQDGENIVGWTPKAWYVETGRYGIDFTTATSVQSFNLYQTGETVNGYSIDYLLLMPRESERCRVVFARSMNVAGTLSINETADVVVEGEEALATGSEWNSTLALNGTLKIRNPGDCNLLGTVNYGPQGALSVVADTEHDDVPSTIKLEQDLPGTEWAVVARGVSLRSVTNVTACIGGSGWFGPAGYQLRTYYFTRSNYDKELSCQFQYWDGTRYVKGVAYRLRETNDCLEAKVDRAGYWDSSAAGTGRLGTDEGERSILNTSATSSMNVYTGTENGYGIKDIRLFFDGVPYGRSIGYGLAAVNGSQGRLTFSGSATERFYVRALNHQAMDVSLTVETNAVCDFRPLSGGENKDFGLKKTYRFNNGGEFWHQYDWSISCYASYSVSGGVFHVDRWGTRAAGTICNLYVCGMTFEDGGRLTGYPPRSGYYNNPLWTVKGSSPAIIEPGLGIVGNSAVAMITNTFDVADVTANAEADLVIGGRLFYSNSNWVNAQIVKKGSGTVTHQAANTITNAPLRVLGGTWNLGVTGSTTMDNALSLEGGTIAVVDGCTNAFGVVSLASGTVNGVEIGTDAALAFGTYAADAGATLAVESPMRKPVLRIGTSQCLTSAQLHGITINGECVHQNADGYVLPGLAGVVLIIR